GVRESLTSCCLSESRTHDFELHVDVATGGIGVRADFLVRFRSNCREVSLSKTAVFDTQIDRETESADVAWPDRYGAGYLGLRRVLAVLLADEVQSAAKAGRIARSEQMLGGRRTGFARPPHLFGHR